MMTATASLRAEFSRKARTLLRGMTALFGNATLLNPFRHPAFSFILVSHKLARWLAPLALAGCLAGAWLLRAEPLYSGMLYAQLTLYALAIAGLAWPALAARSLVVRFSAFFLLVNAAAAKAFALWIVGVRQEVWEPTRRPA